MDLLRHPRVGAWAVADDRDSADYEKRNLLATVENLRAELLARDALVESLQQEINMLHSIKRTSPVAVVPKQKNGLARKLQLDDLPDGLLLRVFTHMDKLFLANVMSDVCQRWRGLAREPSLWCDVQLTYSNPKGISSRARIFRRVLEVAPAVDTLEWGFSEADPPALRHAVETCTTEATHLCINLDSAAPDAVLRLLWNSRRVLTVFCLREGPLSSSFFSASQASRFWEMIEAASQLQSLVLFLSQRSGLASCVHAFKAQPPRRSSLRTLFVDVGVLDVDYTHGELGVTLQLLIRAHQHTLVDVHLPMRVGTPGALLAASRCPALRVLSTQATADVKTLKNTPSLRELRLTVGKPLMSHYYLLQDVARLEHLTKLRLVQLPPRTDDDLGVSAGLLAVLTPQSALRELALTYLPPAAALDRLCVPPMAAPHLQELKVKQSCGDAADGACRLPAVRRLVLCRPGLHVVLESVAVSDQCCDYHRDLEALRPDLPLTFVGHPRDDCCLERLKTAGTVLLLAPEEVRHTRWCEVAADGTDIPCRPHGHTEAASPASPEESTPVPKESTPVPKESTPEPKESTPVPKESTTVPEESTTLPEESTPLPEESTPLPEESTPLPEESTPLPENVPVSPDAPPSPSSTTTCLKHVCGPIMVSIPLRKVNFSVGAGSAVNSTANANVPMAADSIQHVSGAAHSCGEAPIDALIQGRIDAPVDSHMDIPVDTFVDNPVDDPVHTPMDIPFDSLVEVSVQTPLSTSIALWNGAPCEGHLESATEAAADAPLEAPTQHPTCGPVGVWNGVPLETSMQETADRTSVLQPSRRNSTRSCRRASYRDCYNYPGDQYAFTRKMKVGKVVSTSRRPKAPKARVRSLSGSPCLPSSTESCPATPEPVAPTLNLNAATPEPLDQQQPATLSPSSRGVFFGFKNETPSSGHSPSDRQGSTPSPSLEALEAGSGPSSSYTVVGRAVASLLCTVLPPIPPFDGVPSGAARASWQRDAEGHAVEAAYRKTDGAGCALCPHTPLWCSHRDGVRCQPSTGPSHDDDMELE